MLGHDGILRHIATNGRTTFTHGSAIGFIGAAIDVAAQRCTDSAIRESEAAFLDVAPVLAPGCVLVDLRRTRGEMLSVPRELKARSIPLPVIALDAAGAGVGAAASAMKAGRVEYPVVSDEASFRRRSPAH